MDNRVLFRDGPLRITCSGCGKEFYADEIKRCRACGKYFCRECQKTHDCRIDPSETYVPSFLSSTVPVKSAEDYHAEETQTSANDSEELKSITSEESVSAALVPVNVSADETSSALIPAAHSDKVPYKNTGMYLTDDEAYSAYVREINPYIKCESCGEEYPKSDIWICPKCGAVLCQICRQKHKCPKPEGEQNKLLALLPFTKEKRQTAPKAAVSHITSHTASHTAAASAALHPNGTETLSGDVSAPNPQFAAVKMLTCDHCGKMYPASKLKKCRICGAVLCPKCRVFHTCSSKTDSDGKKPEKSAVPKKKEPEKNKPAQNTAEISPAPKKAVKKDAKESAEATAAPVKKNAARKKDWNELIICDSCGEPYLKSNMRKCRTCGAVLCPKCRRKHQCAKKDE